MTGVQRMLVTGGAGLIGANFVLDTARRFPDAEIVVLDLLTYAGNRASLASVTERVRYSNDSTKIRSEPGWVPRYADFESGLAATIDWYRENED